MTNRGSFARTALSALIVAATAMGSLVSALSLFVPPAAAQTCDQPGSAIVGNWVITTPQVCTGIVYTVDGVITINAGGSLTLTNGGLKFTQDTSHIYSLNVNTGGALTLDNSIVTTEPRSLDAYLLLDLNVLGANARFTMRNGAILKFPGTFDTTAGAIVSITDSRITGHLTGEVNPWVGGAADVNDDAPTVTWASSTVDIYDSIIERLFELGTASAPEPRGVITLSGSTTLTAINSYIGVDFDPSFPRHNEMLASGTSRAFLVGVTIDESQGGPGDTGIPPFVPAGGSTAQFHFYRWLDALVTDELGFPSSGTGVWSQWGGFIQTVYYPDNGNAQCPGTKILAYLGAAKTCANFNVTGPDGRVRIPLYTDLIDTTTTPNAASFGNFEETARVSPFSISSSVAFDPYPILTAASHSRTLTLMISGLNLPGTVQWSSTMTITGTVVPLASSLEITGSVTIVDGGIYLSIQSDACNRAVIKVTGTGRLTLINSTLGSNCPMTAYVGNSAMLSASRGSSLNLDAASGSGVLRSDGSAVLTIVESTIDGNVLAAGARVSFKRDAFTGTSLTINTAQKSEVWDANMGTTQAVAFRSDDGNIGTPDFDIRNTTFNEGLTAQIQFSGRQWAQLTNVTLNRPTGVNWWEGMISGNAKVTRYWWLRVEAVDGTGTELAGANALITVRRLDPTTLTWATIGNPGADDIYLASTFAWPVSAPLGVIIYRASAEDRYASPTAQWTNGTYRGEATADVGVPPIRYYPDSNMTAFLQGETTITLTFSALTPEMKIDALLLYYQSNQTSILPINRPLNVTAVVNNLGSISVRDAVVSFFSQNVDANNDGIMDAAKSTYMAADLWIGDYTIPLLPLKSTRVAWVTWTPTGVSETTRPVSAVVDAPLSDPLDPGTFRELNERNNTYGTVILLHVWPDLSIGSADISLGTAIDGNPTVVEVRVHNDGTNTATNAYAVLTDDAGFVSNRAFFAVGRGQSTLVPLIWVPASAGNHTITVGVYTQTPPAPERTLDYNWVNNQASAGVNVKTKPDVWLNPADFPVVLQPTRGLPFDVPVVVRNNGDTPAIGFSVSVFLNGTSPSLLLGHTDDVSVNGMSSTAVSVRVTIIAAPGYNVLTIFVDSHNTDGSLTTSFGSILESRETNNWLNRTITLQSPTGTIVMNQILYPPNGFAPGTVLSVEGFINSLAGDGLPGLPIDVILIDPQGAVISNGSTTSGAGGAWQVSLAIPTNARDGMHTIRASTTGTGILPVNQQVLVRNPANFFTQILFGLQVWVWLLIVVAALVAVVGLTLYFRVYGIGKMVECGECGSFIPEDSTTCPKCGVEFEREMAKCSNCQAWIPVDVKQCPECGVEFATGRVEMADYQQKMRMQYDEVVAKFRDEAQRILGRGLSEGEFQDWWRKQPTFVTFEDWLREEEEMRKMGSKPCPACGTLNSVTATVCHKCGTYLKEERRPPSGGPGAPPGGEPGAPGEAVPKKVIRKPIAAPPVVQKKVIRKPLGEEGEGGSQGPSDEEF